MYRSTNTKLPFADSNKLAINIGTLIVYYQSSSCEQKKGSSLDTQEDCIYGHFKPKRRNSIKPNRKKKNTKDFNKRREMKWITENKNNNNSTYSCFKKSLISFFCFKNRECNYPALFTLDHGNRRENKTSFLNSI